MSEHQVPSALLGLDWGTTNLRAYLFGRDGALLGTRSSADGVNALAGAAPGDAFPAALRALCGDWLDASPGLPVVASGMVGSTRGWVDAGYRALPADLDRAPVDVAEVQLDGHRVLVLPGLSDPAPGGGVMRGEETELVGLAGDLDGAVVLLPGTHSKWVVLRHRTVLAFDTHLTGEVFALLAERSILSEFASISGEPSPAAFAHGVTDALEAGGALLQVAFRARALVLAGQLAAGEARDYLSGLVIGSELGSPAARRRQQDADRLVLVGDPHLVERYRVAAGLAGWAAVTPVEGATGRGLHRSAVLLGLCDGGRRP